MIIRREALKAALHATTKDDSRYYLHAVNLQPDGTVEATDGAIMVRIHDPHPQDPGDFPLIPGVGTVDAPTAPILLPAETATKLIAVTAKKPAGIPILTSINVGMVDGHRYAVATDLETPLVVNLDRVNTEQRFPTTDRYMVKEGDRPAVLRLTLSAAMLEKLSKMAREISRAKSENAVTLEIPTDGKYQGVTPGPDGVPDGILTSAIRFTMRGQDLTLEGVVMPYRA